MGNLLTKYPGLIPCLLSGFRAAPPRQIDIELTNRCNLKCAMCWFHGAGGIGDRYKGMELTTEEIRGLVTQLAPLRPGIYLGGCEPLMRRDFLPIVEHIKRLKLALAFTTNGILLDPEKIAGLVDLGVEQIIFSLDGDAEIHDSLRGAGVFQKVTANLKALGQYKRKRHSKRPVVTINTTVTPRVVGRLQKSLAAIREATDDLVDCYRIHHLWYITPEELAGHQAETRRYLKAAAPGAACHLTPLSQAIDAAGLAAEIAALQNFPKIQSFPDLRGHELLDFYAAGRRAASRCLAPFYAALIKPDGAVKFCPDEWIDDYVLGNIRETSFDRIWNSAKARRFRAILFRRKSFLGCKRCSWKYSF